ncbi:MAG: CAP domain-containing protein [Deltaproteobacteria bacterium]|nr:MAG: CAP domain-containing protein [Deltaproteobacteria bacterium]
MCGASPRLHLVVSLSSVLALAGCAGDDGGTAVATDPYVPTTGGTGGGSTAGTGGDGTGGDTAGSATGPSTTSSGTSSTTGTASGGDSTGGTTGGGEPDVPTDIPYCQPVVDWDPSWAAREEAIVELVNMYRAQGADCGQYGWMGPASPLVMQPNLRCAARVHSKDMADRGFFDHVNPDGEDPFDRMMKAGYSFFTAGENIAAGNDTAEATMQQWMNSDGHCRNIMNPDFAEIGVGYYPGGQWGHLWTQTFGG